jgi:hypothetical protein
LSTPGNSQDNETPRDRGDTSAFLAFNPNNSKFISKMRVKEMHQLKTERKLKIFKNRLNRAMYGVRPSVKILSGKI